MLETLIKSQLLKSKFVINEVINNSTNQQTLADDARKLLTVTKQASIESC